MKNSLILVLAATLFACQEKVEFASQQNPDTGTITGTIISFDAGFNTAPKEKPPAQNHNIYAELLDSIEAKYQSVLVLKDKKFPVDSTIEKLKAIGFGSIVGANLHENEKFIVEQANDEFKIIEYYRKTYTGVPFIYDEETRKHEFPVILSFAPRGLRPRGQILLAICMRNNMKIFDAHEFPGTIPKNIAKTLLNFRYENILKKDLFFEICATGTIYGGPYGPSIEEQIEADKEWHKKKSQENQYHDYDIRFKILASRSYSKKDSNAIVLFPVKHGYLIVAQWGFEQPKNKSEIFTASLSGEDVVIALPGAPPTPGQILYVLHDKLYWVDKAVARYIDSLKTKVPGE